MFRACNIHDRVLVTNFIKIFSTNRWHKSHIEDVLRKDLPLSIEVTTGNGEPVQRIIGWANLLQNYRLISNYCIPVFDRFLSLCHTTDSINHSTSHENSNKIETSECTPLTTVSRPLSLITDAQSSRHTKDNSNTKWSNRQSQATVSKDQISKASGNRKITDFMKVERPTKSTYNQEERHKATLASQGIDIASLPQNRLYQRETSEAYKINQIRIK